MAYCEWCGKYFPDSKGYTGGPRWNRRYYCSKKCALEGENNLSTSDEAEDNMNFFQRLWRFIKGVLLVVAIIIGIIIIIALL